MDEESKFLFMTLLDNTKMRYNGKGMTQFR